MIIKEIIIQFLNSLMPPSTILTLEFTIFTIQLSYQPSDETGSVVLAACCASVVVV